MAKQTVYYAIGDIHGEASRLQDLHGHIDDFHRYAYSEHVKHIVHLGDYVDRGPNSRKVIEFLMSRQAASPALVTCLMGNHEEMMLDAFKAKNRDFWRHNGGEETLNSYKVSEPENLPLEHIEWMRGLPTTFTPEGTDLIFVHAGVDPRTYPDDNEIKRRWMRGSRFFDTSKWTSPALQNKRVVHGHTPTDNHEADVTPDQKRINVDTGAAYGGPITAAVLIGTEKPIFLQA